MSSGVSNLKIICKERIFEMEVRENKIAGKEEIQAECNTFEIDAREKETAHELRKRKSREYYYKNREAILAKQREEYACLFI